uniref:Uncharacterized protein n=1 Tax=Rhizophora mucronata TaxID=61149 RepID=A0A2P2R3E8_RHIMU
MDLTCSVCDYGFFSHPCVPLGYRGHAGLPMCILFLLDL